MLEEKTQKSRRKTPTKFITTIELVGFLQVFVLIQDKKDIRNYSYNKR